jgi:hypothetical protein
LLFTLFSHQSLHRSLVVIILLVAILHKFSGVSGRVLTTVTL